MITMLATPRRSAMRSGASASAERRAQVLVAVQFFCGYLAVAVLAGLLANTLFGLWWVDPAVALLIAAVAVREGRKALRGEACSCASCAPVRISSMG